MAWVGVYRGYGHISITLLRSKSDRLVAPPGAAGPL